MLTDEQRRRYARNISLAGVGVAGQERLLASGVLVIGAGGLGSPAISYLAATGVGHLGIADFDRVELSNLQRQTLHENADIGRPKTHSARDRVQELNPDVKISLYEEKITVGNAAAIIRPYDLVLDGSDNFATRFALNDACHKEKKTLVSGAVRAFAGQLAVFKSYLGAPQPCYRCFVSAHPEDERGCADVGVLGALTGVVGSLMALEATKELLGGYASLGGKLLLLEGETLRQRIVTLTRDPHCECCGR